MLGVYPESFAMYAESLGAYTESFAVNKKGQPTRDCP